MDVAKKGKDQGAAVAGDDGAGSKPAKKSKRAKRRLGPATVARPCLVGAGILTLLGAILPR